MCLTRIEGVRGALHTPPLLQPATRDTDGYVYKGRTGTRSLRVGPSRPATRALGTFPWATYPPQASPAETVFLGGLPESRPLVGPEDTHEGILRVSHLRKLSGTIMVEVLVRSSHGHPRFQQATRTDLLHP